MPDRKKITDIKWLAVYDLTQHEVYGDIYIPEDFEPPGSQILTDLVGRSNGVRFVKMRYADIQIWIPEGLLSHFIQK